MGLETGFGVSQKPPQGGGGPPFPITAADNGLSVDLLNGGKIVLGNDVGSFLAAFTKNREVPMAGFSLLLSGAGTLQFASDIIIPLVWNTIDNGLGTAGNFLMTLDQSLVNADGVRDAVLQWGYNQNGGGGRQNPIDAEIHFAIESHFIPFPGGQPQFEVHLETTGLDNNKARYFSLTGGISTPFASSFWTVETMNWFRISNQATAYASLDSNNWKLRPTAGGTLTWEMQALNAGDSGYRIITENNGTGDITIANTIAFGRIHQVSSTHFDGYPASGYDFLFRSASNTNNQLFSIINHSGAAKFSMIENTGSVIINGDTYVAYVDTGDQLQVVGSILFNNPSFMLKAATAMNDGAAANAGTLLNAPAAGNPTKWIPFNDAGVIRFIPAW